MKIYTNTAATLFICDPWESYMRQLEADSDREQLEMEKQLDLDRQEEIDREIIEQIIDGGCEPEDLIPFYAASPLDVEYPEVIEAEIDLVTCDEVDDRRSNTDGYTKPEHDL